MEHIGFERRSAASRQSAEGAALTADSPQRIAVLTALAANAAIAVAKFGAAAITGSSAMLAEAFHSSADSVNEALLLVGARRSLRPADRRHPFGHARYRYLYAFLVSLTVFWLGGVLAVVEGIVHLSGGETLVDPRWAFGVLAIAAVLEGWTLRTTLRVGRPSKGQLTWKRLIQVTRAPELIVVFLEDLGALIGIGIAAAGVALTTITGQGMWDAVASIAIGVLLATIGLVVNRETQSLLVGESARDEVVAAIRKGDHEHRRHRWRRRAADHPCRAGGPRGRGGRVGRSRPDRDRPHSIAQRRQGPGARCHADAEPWSPSSRGFATRIQAGRGSLVWTAETSADPDAQRPRRCRRGLREVVVADD